MNSLFPRTDRSYLARWWWTVDRGLIAAFLGLFIFGIVLVAAASPPVAERIGLDQYYFIKRHLVFAALSVVVMLAVSLFSARNIWRLSSLVMLGCLGAMVLVLFTGVEIKGAQRWITIFGFSLQPSEFAKPAFAVCAAWLIARQKENSAFPGGRIVAGLFVITILLLLLQPDLGMSVVVGVIYGTVIFLAGFPMWLVGGLMIVGCAGLVGSYFAFSHVKSRFDRFFDPSGGDSYQVQKALEAFQNGGFFGTGPGQGTVKLYIPDAHADFIFAVAGEELGFLFVAILIGLFLFVLLRGLNRIMDSEDLFAVLAVGALLAMFGVQAFVHMATSVHLMPTKGMTLPFISYGGSSLLAMAYAMGMVLALTRRRGKTVIARGSAISKKQYMTGKTR